MPNYYTGSKIFVNSAEPSMITTVANAASTWNQWSQTASLTTTYTITQATTTGSIAWDSWSESASTTAWLAADKMQRSYHAWDEWSSSATNYRTIGATVVAIGGRLPETSEAREARLARETAARAASEAAARAREIAIAKADKLLESILDEVQRAHLKETDSFMVVGKSGKLYRVRRGRSGNVDEVAPDGKILQRYCAHPIALVPDGDTMVAQKLMLECDEDAFLGMANRHGVPMGARGVPLEMIERTLAARSDRRIILAAA